MRVAEKCAALVAILAVLMAAFVAACSQTPLEKQLVDDAAATLGGAERIEAIETIVIMGEGRNARLGQNLTPEADLNAWRITEFERTLDVRNGRMRVQQLRTATFPFPLALVGRDTMGLDGDVAYNVNPAGVAARGSALVARERRLEMLHHPLTIVRAALQEGARISNLRTQDQLTLVDLTTPEGDTVTLGVDTGTKLPALVRSTAYHVNLGDVVMETAFLDYADAGGLRVPRHLTTKTDRWVTFDLQATSTEVNSGAGDLAAPEAVRGAAVPPIFPPADVTAEEVGAGIWRLAGTGAGPFGNWTIAFEFDDHITLFEVPENEFRSQAVIDKAKTLRPGKPVTHVIVSHHHFDHSAGLRTAVADGLTIITHRANEGFFKELASRPHTLHQDALARNPKPITIEPMDDELTLSDGSMDLRLYHVKDSIHGQTTVVVYVPRDRMLVQSDLYDPVSMQFPWADNFLANLKMRNLRVDKSVPTHGQVQTFPEVLATIKAKQTVGTN